MKRLLLPLTACLCLLTACPSATPQSLQIPDGPAALSGAWQGTLTSAVDWWPMTAGGGLIYVLRRENGIPGQSNDTPLHPESFQVVALDELTGRELQRGPWSHLSNPPSYRAASGSQPARLLSVEDDSGTTSVVERDPLTLAQVDRWPLPAQSRNARLSLDGTRLELSPSQVLDTRTRQALPLHPEVQKVLSLLPKDALVSWGVDMHWLVVRWLESSSAGRVERVALISNDTGQIMDGQALHPVGCDTHPEYKLSSEPMALPDGGVALAYPDGIIELRRADGTLRASIPVQTEYCLRPEIRVDGDTVTFAVPGGIDGAGLGTLRVSDGQITARAKREGNLSLLLPGAVVQREGRTLSYQRLDGVTWNKVGQTKRLRLDTQATWISASEYHVTGQGQIDGQTLNFTAKATSYGIELRPQWSYPPMQVEWRGELRRPDGSLYGRLLGIHTAVSTEQQTSLELAGQEQDFAFGGTLTR